MTTEQILSLENSVILLKKDKSRLIQEMNVITEEGRAVKSKLMAVDLDVKEYESLGHRRMNIKRRAEHINHEIVTINAKIKSKNILKTNLLAHVKKNDNSDAIKIEGKTKNQIIFMRNKYQSFAGDTTRVSSLRAMAARFSEELTELIN